MSVTHEGVHETFCQSPAMHLFSNVPLRVPRCTGARKEQLLDILQQTGRARAKSKLSDHAVAQCTMA